MDVTDRQAVQDAVTAAHEHFGRLDIVVNNAGYGLFGMVEEVTERQARTQMDTNFVGALNVTQAVLPLLRAQGGGHIVQISSMGGVVAFPSLGLYHASKWALEGMTESLAQEVAPFGIKVTLVEPGGFGTDWSGPSAAHAAHAAHAAPIDAYQPARDALAALADGTKYGDPKAAATALLEVVDAEQPPLRVLFGAAPHHLVKQVYAERLRTWADRAGLRRRRRRLTPLAAPRAGSDTRRARPPRAGGVPPEAVAVPQRVSSLAGYRLSHVLQFTAPDGLAQHGGELGWHEVDRVQGLGGQQDLSTLSARSDTDVPQPPRAP
ncbi:SDR family NAD(P)-dependent oxidoreductase [Streptomyces sp. NPDC000994]